MLNARLFSALGLFAALLCCALPADAAPKKNVDAIRAECFKQANAAAQAQSANMSSGATAAANSAGYSTYRSCAQKNGIRP
ncbi:hypothetical protein ACE103_06305 [Bradyrhizobium sp. ma5]|uniref:hypothetical protein n=1 Tax=Bradyrhizobium sp. ma5 TaxID=3344828 RepID=UPI0035D48D38